MAAKKRAQHMFEYLFGVDGKALSQARIAAGFSMDDLAQELGCNKGQISKWEQQRLSPSPARIWKMVELFGTQDFIRLNHRVKLTDKEIETVRKLRA